LAGVGHALFAVTLVGIGVAGLVTGRFGSIWQSVPHGVPGRRALAYLCACVSLGCGGGLFRKRASGAAARVLFAYLLLWLLLIKGYYVVSSPTVEVNYQSAGETAVLAAGAWVLYAWFGDDWDSRHLRWAVGENGERCARVLYALALVAFGLSHFAYLELTAPLVPAWLPAHVFWAYFTGSTYLAAALAMLSGVLARPAAALSALQMGLFTLLVWTPRALTGRLSAGQWIELEVSWALTAAAWVVADSWRRTPRWAGGER
jgi:uncharacterized membrane protein YphA (DoxX/SURF4 family)